jgi:adenine-specific DNA-methyltransferase
MNRGYLEVARQRLSGAPDEEGNFPNLRSLRQYAEEQGLSDVSRFSFTRQVGVVATTRREAKILPEQEHLSRFIEQTEGEAEHPAHRRFATPEKKG